VRLACASDLFDSVDHMPTYKEEVAACGGVGDVDIYPAADGFATPLEIELDGADVNDLPLNWW
jgi:hypothetical protein